MNFFQEVTDIQSSIDQGDFFVDIDFPAIDTRVNCVVITPTCDLQQQKAQFIKFIPTVPLDFVIKIIADSIDIDESYFHSVNRISRKKHDKLLNTFRRNTSGDFLPRYFLLPKYGDIITASYLDFQMVFVKPFHQVLNEYISNRRARILSPWRDSIASQYAGYSMRIGTPLYSDDELDELLKSVGLKLPE